MINLSFQGLRVRVICVEHSGFFITMKLFCMKIFCMISFQGAQNGKGSNRVSVTLEWRNQKNTISQVIKVNIDSNKSCWQCVHLIWCNENDALSLWSSPQRLMTLIIRKILDKFQFRNTLKKYQYSSKLSRSLKARQVWETVTFKRDLGKWDNYKVVSWVGPWNRERILHNN